MTNQQDEFNTGMESLFPEQIKVYNLGLLENDVKTESITILRIG